MKFRPVLYLVSPKAIHCLHCENQGVGDALEGTHFSKGLEDRLPSRPNSVQVTLGLILQNAGTDSLYQNTRQVNKEKEHWGGWNESASTIPTQTSQLR